MGRDPRAEKVEHLGIERQPASLYSLAEGTLLRTDMTTKKTEIVCATTFVRDMRWLYFLDEIGDISRVPRASQAFDDEPAASAGPRMSRAELLAAIGDDVKDELASARPLTEVVARPGITQEKGWLYFLRDTTLWRTPMAKAGATGGKAEKLADDLFVRDPEYLYVLGKDCAVHRRKRPT